MVMIASIRLKMREFFSSTLCVASDGKLPTWKYRTWKIGCETLEPQLVKWEEKNELKNKMISRSEKSSFWKSEKKFFWAHQQLWTTIVSKRHLLNKKLVVWLRSQFKSTFLNFYSLSNASWNIFMHRLSNFSRQKSKTISHIYNHASRKITKNCDFEKVHLAIGMRKVIVWRMPLISPPLKI